MDHGSFAQKYGPWALITGGASGIGAELGRQLAARGLNLVIVDVQTALMKGHAGKLMGQYGISVRCVNADLQKPIS